IINRGRLTESKNIGSLGHGVSLSSRGSGRLVTRLDTPPSSHRHHPDSAIAVQGLVGAPTDIMAVEQMTELLHAVGVQAIESGSGLVRADVPLDRRH
ncbi:hypothetical protein, partial [Bradyrhizobium sp. Mp27]|uniref:hypothetical protein n=1 Tax=Bradyrhizobium sp. Mp27 TaxID=3042157 RepID=UPI00248BF2B2